MGFTNSSALIRPERMKEIRDGKLCTDTRHNAQAVTSDRQALGQQATLSKNQAANFGLIKFIENSPYTHKIIYTVF
ncbi:hypothetical protein [Limnohabitans sp. Jir72]|uniref:hypothetical protein n=1 Tax=Limnohabitans sp. Jir72 TaxID=1977909 RepID=UPI0011B1DFCC|nr:hypothetical protein [Limnohabitans sp. Jir72]